jgi:hypothetical protein
MVIQGMAVQAIDGANADALEAMATRAMMAWPSKDNKSSTRYQH